MTAVAQPPQMALAMRLAEAADHPVEWPGLGRREPGPIRLLVVPDAATMQRMTRGGAPSWGAALALPGIHTIIIRADVERPEASLRHELAHLVLHDAVRVRVPLWFDEGYAAYASGEWDRMELLGMNLALATGSAPDLRELDAMLRDSEGRADIAYALATSAVLELGRRHPGGRLDSLFVQLERGVGFDEAVLATTGLTLPRFELAWQDRLRHRYNLMGWLIAGGFWVLVALFVATGVLVRRHLDGPRREALNEGWTLPEEADLPPPSGAVDPGSGIS